MVRFDLTSKKIPPAAYQNLIAKLFGQQPVKLFPGVLLKYPLSLFFGFGSLKEWATIQISI
jgi:hypothetical protein